MRSISLPRPGLLVIAAAFAAAPLSAQTPAPITPPGGGTIVTAVPSPSAAPTVINPAGGGTIVTATPVPTAAPAVIKPSNGGSIVTKAPAPSAAPAVIKPSDGGEIVRVPPTPTPAPVTALAAAAVAHERRLVRDIQQNSDNVKSKGNFGSQLWLITDADFFLSWRKREMPTIAPIEIAVRGQPVYTAIIFYGAGRDEKGLTNVTYDVTVRRPDNTVYTVSNGLIGFQNLGPTDEKQLLLGRNYVGINISQTDPAGLYTVEAMVHDNIGRADLSLIQHFVVQPN